MKKLILLFLLALCQGAVASTWVISRIGGNFADINAAMKSVSVKDGDVLHVGTVVGNANEMQTVTKRVTIEGPGFKRTGSEEEVNLSARVINLCLQEDGIVVTKLQLQGDVHIRANEAVIEKCLVNANIIANEANYDSEDFTLRQCYVQDAYVTGMESEDQQGWHIHNNIFVSRPNTAGLCLRGINGGQIDRNIFYTDYPSSKVPQFMLWGLEECTFTNNIVTRYEQNGSSYAGKFSMLWTDNFLTLNTVTNNVFSGNSIIPNNMSCVTPEEVYYWGTLDGVWSEEAKYMLADGSVAKGYATDGGDCGPWTGDYAYLLGGVEAYVPAQPATPLSGEYWLDLNKADNAAGRTYQTLQSLFTALTANGIGGDLQVNVASGNYDFQITDDTLPLLTALYALLMNSTHTVKMVASEGSGVVDYAAYTKYSGFTVTDGTPSYFSDEAATCLVDNNNRTKWCYEFNTSSFTEFYASSPFIPVGYELTTANDTQFYTGRNPKSWTLKAKLNATDGWSVIGKVENDIRLQPVNYTAYNYPLSNSEFYKYFRFEISANGGDKSVQLSELRLYGTTDPTAATGGATFNFTMGAAFLLSHAAELATLTQNVKQMLSKIKLQNISVLFNGMALVNNDFQVEANDLLALKNMYNAFGGDNWTTKKWSFASNGKSRDDFPGVTFSDAGRVTAIDLQDNGLAGEMFSVYSPSFEELASLNLSRNALTGDIGLLVGNLPKLRTLNMAYNRLSGLSKSLPATCTSVDLQYQNRIYGNIDYLTDNFYNEQAVTVSVNTQSDTMLPLPSLYTYYGSMRRGLYGINGPSPMIGMLNDTSNGWQRLSLNSGYTIYTYPQDTKLAVIQEEGVTRHSAYPIILHYAEGDADMDGLTNVLDVQYTLTYILAANTLSRFNYSAANTYTDNNINVQDIVATVNIILSSPATARRSSPEVSEGPEVPEASAVSETPAAPETPEGTLFSRDGQLLLTASRPVAAIDVELEGVSTSEVAFLLSSRDYQMIGRNTEWGSRYVIFSPTGKSIAPDTETPLLRLAAYAQPVGLMCADPEAKSVAVAVSTTPTGIAVTESKPLEKDNGVYDLQGRRVEGRSKGLYIVNGRKVIY